MPKHERDEESIFEDDDPTSCAVPWCDGNAPDSEYCWDHATEYTDISVTYE